MQPHENETIDQKLARLRAEKAKRDEIERGRAKLREAEALEVDEKLTRELGPRGKAFQIIATNEGPIAVKLGEPVAYKQYIALFDGQGKEPTFEETVGFVTPAVVHPSTDKAQDMFFRLTGLANVVAIQLAKLYRGEEIDTRGK